jgi:hypothetical protein
VTFKFQIYPSWFGGPVQADFAIVELAEHQAKHERLDARDIYVDRSRGDRWLATVEFAQ